MADTDGAGDLDLGQPVGDAEVPQAGTELKQATAETADLEFSFAVEPFVLEQRHADDEFPRNFIRNLGVSERMVIRDGQNYTKTQTLRRVVVC